MTLSTLGQSERVVDAIRAAAADTEEDMAEAAADEAVTRSALELLGSKRNDAYEAALTASRETPKPGGRTRLPAIRTRWARVKKPRPPMSRDCGASSKTIPAK